MQTSGLPPEPPLSTVPAMPPVPPVSPVSPEPPPLVWPAAPARSVESAPLVPTSEPLEPPPATPAPHELSHLPLQLTSGALQPALRLVKSTEQAAGKTSSQTAVNEQGTSQLKRFNVFPPRDKKAAGHRHRTGPELRGGRARSGARPAATAQTMRNDTGDRDFPLLQFQPPEPPEAQASAM